MFYSNRYGDALEGEHGMQSSPHVLDLQFFVHGVSINILKHQCVLRNVDLVVSSHFQISKKKVTCHTLHY